MQSLWRDVLYGARVLARSRGFTAVVVLTLALGIGANTAIFSVVNAVLLRPLDVEEPDRLAVLWEVMPRGEDAYMFASPPSYVDWRERSRAFREMGAFAPREFFLARDDGAVRLHGARVTASLFPTLGVAPALGRGFTPEDDRPGAGNVVILSHGLWRTRFGADPDIQGTTIRLDDGDYNVIGVMPPEFRFPPAIDLEGRSFPRRNDLWVPFAMDMAGANRGAHFMTVVGRLRPGVSLDAADTELRAVAAGIAEQFPDSNAGWGARAVSFNRVAVGDVRLALLVLLGAVGVVLLIACVNVANLLLARSAARQREFAIRAALGAGRWPLIRHTIVESQLLALLGGAAGLALAYAGLGALLNLAPDNVPRLDEARVDLTVAAYALVVSMLTGLAFGLVPALRTFAPDVARLMNAGGRAGGPGREQSRLRGALVVAEVALSMALLVGAGLLFRSFLELRGVDTGVRAENVLTLRVTLPASLYPDEARRAAAFEELRRRVGALPGIESAGFSLDVPLASDYQGTRLAIDGQPPPRPDENRSVHFSVVTAGYFRSMGIPLAAGRDFDDGDAAGAAPVVVINRELARRFFPDQDPIGRVILFEGQRRIVGVTGDVRLENVKADPTPAMFVPHAQAGRYRSMSFVVRTRLVADAAADAVQTEIRALDRGIAIYDVRPMDRILADSVAQPRFSALMLLVFSAVALLLAAVGVYGVIGFAVSTQRREIGIRMALGASPGAELRRVVRQALRLLAPGLAIGLAAALAGGRLVQGLLFGVRPADPVVLGAVAAFLLAVGVAASLVPARRASRVDPMQALRYE